MTIRDISETVEFTRPVSMDDIREAIDREHGDGRAVRPKVVRDGDRFRLGRSGRYTEFDALVVPSAGNRWFARDRTYHGIQVLGCEWHGRKAEKQQYQASLHKYYVRQFADRMARQLGGKVVDARYGDDWPKLIPVCSRDRCWQPATYSPDIGLSCPRHGTFTELVYLPLHKPAH